MTIGRLAGYLAPVFWFSPDEPLLEERSGAQITIPEPFPFEPSSGRPVVYYQLERLLVTSGPGAQAVSRAAPDKADWVLDLERIRGFDLTFFAYFHSEEGFGAHPHDVEPVEFRAVVLRDDDPFVRESAGFACPERSYLILVTRVSAKAHGLEWYWNVLETDRYSRFPMFVLVEEGKHALCTDKNADGYYTPGFDVSRYVNDAWGVRDVVRTGGLLSSRYEAWMTKVRRPEHRVWPPIPEDSPLLPRLMQRERLDGPGASYELRALPAAELAEDPKLLELLAPKEIQGWPALGEASTGQSVLDFVEEGDALGSLAIALRLDGEVGFSFAFPFFLVRNLEIPLSGGFVVWRLYLEDTRLRDRGVTLMYTPSASRWFDTYLAAGMELDREPERLQRDFVLETGVKLRVDVERSPAKLLGVLTEFWGVRFGIKSKGFFDIDRLTYVIEVGAGAW